MWLNEQEKFIVSFFSEWKIKSGKMNVERVNSLIHTNQRVKNGKKLFASSHSIFTFDWRWCRYENVTISFNQSIFIMSKCCWAAECGSTTNNHTPQSHQQETYEKCCSLVIRISLYKNRHHDRFISDGGSELMCKVGRIVAQIGGGKRRKLKLCWYSTTTLNTTKRVEKKFT